MTRAALTLILIFTLAFPALAERPRPLGWAMDAVRAGNWDNAKRIAQRDGAVAQDIIEWHRLRAGLGTYDDVKAFLSRRPDWPGENYLRRKSEDAVIALGDAAVLEFFEGRPPQTPIGVLAYAAALRNADRVGEADTRLVLAWRTMPMNAASQAMFVETYGSLLKPHHAARLDELLWRGEHAGARQIFDLVGSADKALAETRIALQNRKGDVNEMINALPASTGKDAGLQKDRFEWRIRKGFEDSAKDLLLSQSVSAAALGQPAAWANRRRALARDEMRSGDPKRAYQMASQHFLEDGSHFADLEWLSGYIALRFLKDPKRALTHFKAHDGAVESPISQGRAGYWQGRALQAMGDAEGAAKAYSQGAKFQSSFYGLLAAERGGLPFDQTLAGDKPKQDWRTSALAQAPLFQAGML
ncbi:MAG: lytic transglycosylase domain-containing protein, partial [Sulfitobacter sp.]|nr:lytic transglycosylase domain-containing protein [Sulfitobacter sp.]